MENIITGLTESKNIEKLQEQFWQKVQETLSISAASSIDQRCLQDYLIPIAALFDDFITTLFNNRFAVSQLQKTAQQLSPIIMVQRQFIQRQALKRYCKHDIDLNIALGYENELKQAMHMTDFNELQFSQCLLQWMDDPDLHQNILQKAQYYCAANVHFVKYSDSLLFNIPGYLPYKEKISKNAQGEWSTSEYKKRHFFSLTDSGASSMQIANHTHYCLTCHIREKDSCRTGIVEKDLTGCPLDQKISEMILLKREGLNIAALAIAMVDNPLLALTGHRICQDCSSSCIYQAREPVNVPGIETQILENVLELPWGFEIYYLLTYWNPFNLQRPIPKAASKKSILVIGLGPAGLNLAYHLLQEGHDVVAVDGLKVEPLEKTIPDFVNPIQYIKTIFQDLDQRKPQGFGGVAEYGITSRWNKNYLTLIRLILERRQRFSVFGGVHIDIQTQAETAFQFFDHIALCTGAGKPKAIPLLRNQTNKTGYIKGVRFANDFLMTLQGSGAFHPQSFVNLTLELPVAVIGGGLTAIDTATEALAYYPRQIFKFSTFYHKNLKKDPDFIQQFTPSEQQTIQQWLIHAELLKQEQTEAAQQGREVNFLPLLKQWGGVTIYYRGNLKESPSYRQCFLEVEEALQQGVVIKENTQIVGVQSGEVLQIQEITASTSAGIQNIPVRTLLLATGIQHSSVQSFSRNPFLYAYQGSRPITYFGDAHPDYRGSVVKAMASAKAGYPFINQLLAELPSTNAHVHQKAKHLFTAKVVKVNDFSQGCQVTVHYPWGGIHYQPGHFFRLQLFQDFSDDEGIFEAVAIQISDQKKNDLTFLLKNYGGSSKAYQKIKPGMEIVLTGPTGKAFPIAQNQQILIIIQHTMSTMYQTLLKKIAALNKTLIYVVSKEKIKSFSLNMTAATVIFKDSIEEINESFSENFKPDQALILGDPAFSSKIKSSFPKDFLHIPITGVCCPPMQCTLKGVCGQCIQSTSTGELIFACENIYQPLFSIDYSMTEARLSQNSIHEKIIKIAIDSAKAE